MRESLLASARTILAELEAGTAEELTAEAVASIRSPITVIAGDRSVPFMQKAVLRAAEALPAARVVRIPGADHMLPVENPDELARAVHEAVS